MGLVFSSRGFLFKGAPVFALGYYTNEALTPNVGSIIEETKQYVAEAESLDKACLADEAEVKEMKKKLLDLLKLYKAELEELMEMRNAVDDNRRKKLSGASCEEMDQKKLCDLVQRE